MPQRGTSGAELSAVKNPDALDPGEEPSLFWVWPAGGAYWLDRADGSDGKSFIVDLECFGVTAQTWPADSARPLEGLAEYRRVRPSRAGPMGR